ncbi:DMT family transporter [Comamonadaceae bacterium M7527]|nr:DMT family transporter [Comamonadaceae bacterium M7527]
MSRLTGNTRGMASMLLAMGCFAAMDTVLKIMSADLPPMQMAALRGLGGLPFLVVYLWRRKSFKSIVQVRWGLQVFRGLLAIVMLWSFSVGIKELALTQAYTLFFIAPLLVSVLAWPILGEKAHGFQWFTLLLGLAGVVVALRPSTDGLLTWGSAAVLGAATCYAISAVVSRRLSRTDTTDSQVFWVLVFLGFGAGLLALPNWQPLTAQHWALMPALATSGFIGQLAITDAFKHGRAAAVAPFEYSALGWSIGIDVALWSVWPDALTLGGATIVMVAGLLLMRRERGVVASTSGA